MRISDLDLIKSGLSTGLPEVLTDRNKYYIDIRVEAGEGVGAYSENGSSKVTSQDWSFSLGVRVIDKSGIPAAGFYGRQLGGNDLKNFNKIAREMIVVAKARARANSLAKAGFKKKTNRRVLLNKNNTELNLVAICSEKLMCASCNQTLKYRFINIFYLTSSRLNFGEVGKFTT